jgi:hypothetical protein
MSIHPQEFFSAVGCGYIFIEIPALPRSTAIVRQRVAVRFLIGMSLVDFGCVSKREG